jgi:hypothetical protein
MATVPGTRKNDSTHEPIRRPEGGARQPSEWKGVLCLLLFVLGLFALVAWLISISPESAGSSNFQYWPILP